MSTEHKKEKRKLRKQKKREERIKEEIEKRENEPLDIIHILKSELYDTKPNMAKLLQKYVKSIRLYISNNIDVYPEFKYNISKIFIRFSDGSELMRFTGQNGFDYVILYDFDEIKFNEKEKELIEQFFSLLFKFKFIH